MKLCNGISTLIISFSMICGNAYSQTSQSCQDTDPVGDGWGWNGSSSCRVTTTSIDEPVTSTTPFTSNNCIYPGGDTNQWGWDNVANESCPPGTSPPIDDDVVVTSNNCIYPGGDTNQWGWDNVANESCPPGTESTSLTWASLYTLERHTCNRIGGSEVFSSDFGPGIEFGGLFSLPTEEQLSTPIWGTSFRSSYEENESEIFHSYAYSGGSGYHSLALRNDETLLYTREESIAGSDPIDHEYICTPSVNGTVNEVDSRREYVDSRNWEAPVFECNNGQNGVDNTWYWILNDGGQLGGVPLEDAGSWYREDQIVVLTNEIGETTEWSIEQNDLRTSWGLCEHIAGRSINAPVDPVIDDQVLDLIPSTVVTGTFINPSDSRSYRRYQILGVNKVELRSVSGDSDMVIYDSSQNQICDADSTNEIDTCQGLNADATYIVQVNSYTAGDYQLVSSTDIEEVGENMALFIDTDRVRSEEVVSTVHPDPANNTTRVPRESLTRSTLDDLWPLGSEIRVAVKIETQNPAFLEACTSFDEINACHSKMKNKILDDANEWSKHGAVEFIASNDWNNAHVRVLVSQDRTEGNWSKTGYTSVTSTPSQQNTMHLYNTDSGTIIHEFGHTLGFAHEQFSTTNTIEWNRSVSDAYWIADQNWDIGKIESQIYDSVSLLTDPYYEQVGAYDPASVMHYSFKKRYLGEYVLHNWEEVCIDKVPFSPDCIPDQQSLSTGDINGMKVLYPRPEDLDQLVLSGMAPWVVYTSALDNQGNAMIYQLIPDAIKVAASQGEGKINIQVTRNRGADVSRDAGCVTTWPFRSGCKTRITREGYLARAIYNGQAVGQRNFSVNGSVVLDRGFTSSRYAYLCSSTSCLSSALRR